MKHWYSLLLISCLIAVGLGAEDSTLKAAVEAKEKGISLYRVQERTKGLLRLQSASVVLPVGPAAKDRVD